MADKKFWLFFGAKVDVASLIEMKKKFSTTMKGLEESSKKMRDIGKDLSMYVSLPLAAIAALSLKTAGDFEEAMITLQAKSGAVGDEFDTLRNKALSMSKATKYSAKESAEAMTEFIKAGLSTADTLAAVDDATALATASKMEMAKVVTIASDTMSQFNLQASDMGDIADTLMMAADASTTEVDQLSEALKYAGIVAGASGISLQETAAILAALAKSGIKGSMAGTSFANVINGFRAPSREAKKAFAELGLGPEMFADSAGNMKMSIKDAMATLKAHGITATQMNKIFEKEGGNAFSGMMKNLGRIDEYNEAIARRSGYASGQAKKGMAGLNSAIIQVKNSFDTLKIAMGDAGLLKWATNAALAFKGLLNSMAGTSPVTLRLLTIIGGATIGLISMVAAVGLLGGAIVAIKKNLMTFMIALRGFSWAGAAGFGVILAKAALLILAIAGIYLVLDDLWAWFEGRPSVFGELLKPETWLNSIKYWKDKYIELVIWLKAIFKNAFLSIGDFIKDLPLIRTLVTIADIIAPKDKSAAASGGVLPSISTPIGEMSRMQSNQSSNQTLNVNPVIDIVVNGPMGGDPTTLGNSIGSAIAGHVRSAADSLKPAYAQ